VRSRWNATHNGVAMVRRFDKRVTEFLRLPMSRLRYAAAEFQLRRSRIVGGS